MGRSVGLADFNGASEFLFRFVPCLPSECVEAFGKQLAGLFVFPVGLVKATQQFMHDYRQCLTFKHEGAHFAGRQTIEVGYSFIRHQHLGSQILIQAVHPRCRVDGISGGAVLIMIAGADIAEKNLA